MLCRLLLLVPLLILMGCSVSSTTPAPNVALIETTSAEGEAKSEKKTPDAKDPTKEEKGAAFVFPTDAAGKLLAKELPPTPPPSVLRGPRQTKPAMPEIKAPEPVLLLPSESTSPPRLSRATPAERVRPQFVAGEPFGEMSLELFSPRVGSFSLEKPIKFEVDDVSIPPAMPTIGTQAPDRVPTDDVTLAASTQAVQSAKLPERTTPAPFVRERTPEPYENRGNKQAEKIEEALPH
jgi:hypothetical protein